MNIADPFKQLVERKLWPIALLLVAALLAVPFLLAKDPEAPVLPTAVATGAGGSDATESVVTLDDATRVDDARTVLGARKDPFRPAQLHPVPTVEDSLGESASGTQTTSSAGTSTSVSKSSTGSSGSSGSTGSSGSGTTAAPTSEPAVVEPDLATVTLPLVSFDLKRSGSEVAFELAKRLRSYPSASNPVALFLGLDERGKAVFSLDEGVTIEGDGKCVPAKDNCDALVLGNQDIVFLTRGDKQYKLIVSIEESEARVSEIAKYWAAEAEDGAEVLKEMGAAGYRYSKKTGVLTEIERKQRETRALRSSASGSKLVSAG